jgi:hypothetical protein
MTREEPSLKTLWLKNIGTMDKVQKKTDRSNTAPSSKTFRDEPNFMKINSAVLNLLHEDRLTNRQSKANRNIFAIFNLESAFNQLCIITTLFYVLWKKYTFWRSWLKACKADIKALKLFELTLCNRFTV